MDRVAQRVLKREEPTIDLFGTLRILWYRWKLVACVFLIFMCGAAIYTLTAAPRYTATAMLLFDARKIEPFPQQEYPSADINSAFVDSQIEVLKSENLARSVIEQLNLLSDLEFAPAEGGRKGSNETVLLARVVSKFHNNLVIKRLGLTYVVSVSYRSLDPDKAARISNALAEAYIVAELDSKSQVARRANVWLEDRLRELRNLVENTEKTIATFKADNSSARPDSVQLNEAQVADVSTQRRVVLRDLESSVQAYRALHEKLLRRVAEFTQQQSFPATEARLVSAASPPLQRSEPKESLILGVASLLGLLAGVGVAFARDYVDNGVRSPIEVEQKLGITCLGVLPNIGSVCPPIAHDEKKAGIMSLGMFPAISDLGAVVRQVHERWLLAVREMQERWLPRRHSEVASYRRNETMAEVDLYGLNQQTERVGRGTLLAPSFEQYRFVVDKPLSHFAETIRSLKVAAEIAGLAQRQTVIGVTSAVHSEGKSLVAANLGAMLAGSGRQVLLIDANPRSCQGLTQRLAPEAKMGLLDFVLADVPLQGVVCQDPITNLNFLPMITPIPPKYCHGIASSSAMKKLLESVTNSYDYIIIDLPAIMPIADVKAVSHLIEHFILVIQYSHTSQDTVVDALRMAPLVSQKLLGAVLNKAEIKS